MRVKLCLNTLKVVHDSALTKYLKKEIKFSTHLTRICSFLSPTVLSLPVLVVHEMSIPCELQEKKLSSISHRSVLLVLAMDWELLYYFVYAYTT